MDKSERTEKLKKIYMDAGLTENEARVLARIMVDSPTYEPAPPTFGDKLNGLRNYVECKLYNLFR